MLSEEFGSGVLFVFLVLMLSITFGVLFAFLEPYLECMEITNNRRKDAMASISLSTGRCPQVRAR